MGHSRSTDSLQSKILLSIENNTISAIFWGLQKGALQEYGSTSQGSTLETKQLVVIYTKFLFELNNRLEILTISYVWHAADSQV